MPQDPVDELLEKFGEWYGPLTDDELAEGMEWWKATAKELSSASEQ